MKPERNFRAFYVIPSSLLLILALGRCSPIAPSVSKQTLINASQRGAAPDSAVTAPSPASQPMASSLVHVLLYKTRVLDGDAFADAVERTEESKSSRPGTVLIRLNETQVSDLRKSRKVLVQLGGLAPSEVTALLEVSLPRRLIDESDLAAFDSSLSPASEPGAWTLSIPRSPDAERERVAQLVLGNLEQIALQATDPSLVLTAPPVATEALGISGATGARH